VKSPAATDAVIFKGMAIMSNFMLVNSLLGYFDPGSGSLVLQALVGGSAGLMVFGSYVWKLVITQFHLR
jgi:hypothetical protein